MQAWVKVECCNYLSFTNILLGFTDWLGRLLGFLCTYYYFSPKLSHQTVYLFTWSRKIKYQSPPSPIFQAETAFGWTLLLEPVRMLRTAIILGFLSPPSWEFSFTRSSVCSTFSWIPCFHFIDFLSLRLVVWEYKKLFSFRLLEAFFLSTPDVLLKSEAILIPELLGQHLGLSTCSHLLAFFGSSSWCCRQRMLPALSMNKWSWGRQARSQLQPHLPAHPKRIQEGETGFWL